MNTAMTAAAQQLGRGAEVRDLGCSKMAESDAARTNSAISKIETIRHPSWPHVLWIQIHTQNGLKGFGETFYLPGAVEAVIHDLLAAFLIGRSIYDVESIWDQIFSYCNFFGFAGAEMRALSAIDIALWDLIGKDTEEPIFNLLGGRVRESIPIYNTCVDGGQYLDQQAFLTHPGNLAKELISEGIRAMKIWPWDQFAPPMRACAESGPAGSRSMGPSGAFLSSSDLDRGLNVVKQIRDTVGREVEIMIEGHSRWDLNTAIRIARALEPYEILWMEDMIKPDNASDLKRLSSESRVPHCISERLITKSAFREVLELGAAHIVMPDLIWTGGITESKKIAVLADAFHVPIAPHDCTGQIALFANLHLCAASSNAMILETARGFYDGWYREVYTKTLDVENGRALFPEAPGLGVELKPEFLEDAKATTRSVT